MRLPSFGSVAAAVFSIDVIVKANDCVPNDGTLTSLVSDYAILCVDDEDCDIRLSYGPIEEWCTSEITNMRNVFSGYTDFNPDISKWDTSRVTRMDSMFLDNRVFNQDVSKWDTSRVTRFNKMFAGAIAFNQNIGGWDTSAALTMQSMFEDAEEFDQNIGQWDTSKVTHFGAMFKMCMKFDQDLSSWDVSKSVNFVQMFEFAITFNQDLCAWKNGFPFSATMDDMFLDSGCANPDSPVDISSAFCSGGPNCPDPTNMPSSSFQPSSSPSFQPSSSIQPSSSSSPIGELSDAGGNDMPITPVPGWNIKYDSMTVDFKSTSAHELYLLYDISSFRAYEVDMLQKDCSTEITGGLLTLGNEEIAPKSDGYNSLNLAYDIDKSTIASSPIWNGSTSNIEVCHVVRLYEPATSSDAKMIIAEKKRVLNIRFNLTADFSFTNDLEGAEVGNDSESTDMDDYLKACKCDTGFNCNTDLLSPNEELHVCVSSSSEEVGINSITSMVIDQGTENKMTVVEKNDVKYESFSSMSRVNAKNGYIVSVMLPINLFNFSGPNIVVSGSLEMEFSGTENGRVRKLQTGRDVDTNSSPFQLEIAVGEVPLHTKMEHAEEGSSSRKYLIPALSVVASVSILAMLGMLFVFKSKKEHTSAAV